DRRERRFATVADHVNEPRLGDPAVDLLHPLHVVGGLVAPARLALALRVELEEGTDGPLRIGPIEAGVAQTQRSRVEVEVAPLAMAGDDRVRLLAGDPALAGR